MMRSRPHTSGCSVREKDCRRQQDQSYHKRMARPKGGHGRQGRQHRSNGYGPVPVVTERQVAGTRCRMACVSERIIFCGEMQGEKGPRPLGGHFKAGHLWTGQNRPPRWAETD